MYELSLLGAMEKITRRPRRDGGRTRGRGGTKLRHEPPASTHGAPRGHGGHTGTCGRTLQEGAFPHTPQHGEPGSPGCSATPNQGKVPDAGAQAGAPTSLWHASVEASPLSACSPGRLRCLSKTCHHHHQVPVRLASQPAPRLYLFLHSQIPTRMKVYLLSAHLIPPSTGGCIHTTISSSGSQERSQDLGWQGTRCGGEGADEELQAKRATPAPTDLQKQDDFGLKGTGKGYL